MKYLLSILVPLVVAVVANAQQLTIAEKIDSLFEVCDNAFGTDIGLVNCDKLISLARESDNLYAETSANMLKAATYYNKLMYDRVIEFCDSIDNHPEVRKRFPKGYYTMCSYRAESYINKGKYRLAIELAKDIYNAGKDMVENASDDNGRDDGTTVIVAAIENIAVAYRKIGQFNIAIEYLDNGIDMCVKNLDRFFYEYMELVEYKTDFIANSYKKGEPTVFIDEYDEAVLQYKNHVSEDLYENDDAVLRLKGLRLRMKVAMTNDDREAATSYFDQVESIYINDKQANTYRAEYLLIKKEYCMYVGDMNKVVDCCDSIFKVLDNNANGMVMLKLLRDNLTANHRLGRFEYDYDIAMRILQLKDSLDEQRTAASIEEMGTIMGLDMAKLEAQRQKSQKTIWFMIAIITVMGAVIIIVIFVIRQNKQQKRILELEVDRQTKEIKEKNRDIIDSINYAQRIQSALLPDIEGLKSNGIEGAYVFFKPRNIVSGDFYWAHNEGSRMMIACADCTGHGVPGAFMSMIGTTLLNEICANERDLKPGEILERLDAQLISALSQKNNSGVQDGMDMAIMSYDAASHSLMVAGARRPVYFFNNGEMLEIKGTKRSIGERDDKSRANEFTTTQMEVCKGDTLYMCSDGIADQFGGQSEESPNGKRLKSTGLKKMIEQVNKLSIRDQEMALEKMYEEWKGTCYQVDDVSMIGVRF